MWDFMWLFCTFSTKICTPLFKGLMFSVKLDCQAVYNFFRTIFGFVDASEPRIIFGSFRFPYGEFVMDIATFEMNFTILWSVFRKQCELGSVYSHTSVPGVSMFSFHVYS